MAQKPATTPQLREDSTAAATTAQVHAQASRSLSLSGGVEAPQGVVETAENPADEVFGAPESPHREFHCAVVQALSKEQAVVKAAEAPGTQDGGGIVRKSASASLLPLHLESGASLPAVSSSPLSGALESAGICFYHRANTSPPPS